MKKFNLKKVTTFTLSVALAAGIFIGCNNKATDKDEEGTELDTFNARKERFEKDNPDVVI